MPNDRRTKIRIKTYEVTIVRFRTGDDDADVTAYGQRVIQEDDILSSELPNAKLIEEDPERSE